MNEDLQKLHRLANRVHVAIHDITEAEKFAQTFKALRSNPEHDFHPHLDQFEAAIGMAAIISYGRPFVGSR